MSCLASKKTDSPYSNVVSGSLILMLSGVIAGAITALSTPIFSRIYTPEQLGYGAIFFSITTIFLPLTTFRLEYALVNEDDESKIPIILFICAALSITVALLFGASTIALMEHLNAILPYDLLLLIPIFLCTLSFFNLCNFLFTRYQKYHYIGGNQIFQSATRSILIISLAAFTGQGVSIGYLLASFIVCIIITIQIKKINLSMPHPISLKKDAISTLKKHRSLINHSVTTSFTNGLASMMMPIVFSTFFSVIAAGYIFVLQQLIAMPAQLLSQALWRTMFASLSRVDDHDSRRLQIVKVYEIALPLLLIPVLVFTTFSNLFVVLVGEQWNEITPIVGPFSLLVFFNTLSNITSYFITFGKYTAESIWNVTILCIRIGSVFILPFYFHSIITCINYYLIISCLLYFFLNFYWAHQLRFKKIFLLNNVFLVGPVIITGTLVDDIWLAPVDSEFLFLGIVFLAAITFFRYKKHAT